MNTRLNTISISHNPSSAFQNNNTSIHTSFNKNTHHNNSYTYFIDALKFTLKWEGGISYDKHDPGNYGGNATAYGVTQSTYDNYRETKQLPPKSVTKIQHNELNDLYYTKYFKPLQAERLSPKTAKVLFDTAVNIGVKRTAQMYQKVIGSQPDGIIGENTLRQSMLSNEDIVLHNFLHARDDYYRNLAKSPKFSRYLNGWLNRTNDLRKEINN